MKRLLKARIATSVTGVWMLCLSAGLMAGSPSDPTADGATATRSETAAAQPPSRVQPLPALTPSPPYTDRDDMARQPTMQELGLSGHVDLAPMRERANRKLRDWKLQALVGQMEHLDGDRAAAESRYQLAVDAAGRNDKRLRHVLWSRGWARLYSGDNEGALLDWRDAAKLHGGKPEWYPHTLALAYWRAGQRSVGMQWFEASQLSKRAEGKNSLGVVGLPPIATSLLYDMFEVRDLRANSATRRLDADAPAVQAPAHLMNPAPEYPRSALMARASGNVLSLVCIDSQGRPLAQKVIRSSGRSDLDRAATESIREWRFRPASCGGTPHDTWAAVPMSFVVTSGGRPPPPDPEFARTECARDVALDTEGYTAVTESCDTGVVCTAGSVPEPGACAIRPGASAAGSR